MAPVVERRKPIQFAKGHQFEGKMPKGGDRWVAQPKLDGLRMILNPDEDVALTLTGLPIPNAKHILRQMRESELFKGALVDCEGLCTDWNLSQSIIKKQSVHPRAEELKAYCFDILHKSEWESKESLYGYKMRYDLLQGKLHEAACPNLVLVPSWPVNTPEDVKRLMCAVVEHGWGGFRGGEGVEGVMVKSLDAPYAFRKNDYWLKAKPLFDADLTIVGATEGRGKMKGMLGTFILRGAVEWNGKEIQIETETGIGCKENNALTDEVRRVLWYDFCNHRDSIVGRIAEIKHEGITVNNALRFPRFYRLRTDKESGLA